MKRANEILPIGKLAERTGLSVSAIRFYESRGLIIAARNSGNQRRFLRSDIRRLSFILIAQQIGFTIDEIRTHLSKLPDSRTPTRRDWQKLSREFGKHLDERIDLLTRMRDKLDQCIGCGCLSLQRCGLYNPDDRAAALGAGPRFIINERDSKISPENSTTS